jgi:ATP-dependent RNA helicase DHX29
MAPNRKKKKPATNPARGFMTVSVPTKPKPADPERSVLSAAACPHSGLEEEALRDRIQSSSGLEHTSKLHTLSPEQLEKHLEEAELQSLVDKYGPKCKSDSARQVLKLEAEKRALRPQTAALTLTQWFPEEILRLILDTERMERQTTDSPLRCDIVEMRKLHTEEDMCIKAWTLHQTLLRLGFTESRIEEALQYSLQHLCRNPVFNKDPIWALDEAFQWLAMHCDADELPSYGQSSSKLRQLPETEVTSTKGKSLAPWSCS